MALEPKWLLSLCCALILSACMKWTDKISEDAAQPIKSLDSGEGALSELSVSVRIAASGEICIEIYDEYMHIYSARQGKYRPLINS